MAQWDPETGKLKPTWTVRFSPWMTLLGCALAGAITSAVLIVNLALGPGLGEVTSDDEASQGLAIMVALVMLFHLVVGPTLAWGLGFAIRTQTNQMVHVLWFAALGLLVGFLAGGALGLAGVLAPAAGIGAGAARWIMSPYARI